MVLHLLFLLDPLKLFCAEYTTLRMVDIVHRVSSILRQFISCTQCSDRVNINIINGEETGCGTVTRKRRENESKYRLRMVMIYRDVGMQSEADG